MKKRKKKNFKFFGTKIDINTILIIGFIAVFIYGGTKGWFNFGRTETNIVTNTHTIEQLNTPEEDDTSCTASLSKTIITSGESVTGTIDDGANTLCEVYARSTEPYSPNWQEITSGTTNDNGILSFTSAISILGTFDFRVICGECVSNIVTLIVNPPSTTPSCYDSDGKDRLKPGHVTTESNSYYDDCAGNWAVKEYYCFNNMVQEQIFSCDPGYICFETRSGDYCKPTNNPPPTQYYCCKAMGVNACYEGGCPPAGIELGVYDTLSECQASCAGATESAYTCGQSHWCSSGTCPTGYVCNEINSLDATWCGCITDNNLGLVHPDWKPGGIYYNP